MLEILENLEIMTIRFPIILLLAIGIFAFIAGCCICFGSFKKAKPMILTLGILLISLITFIASHNRIIAAAAAAVIALIIALRSERLFTGLIATILVTLIVSAFTISYTINTNPYFTNNPASGEITRYSICYAKEILGNWYSTMNGRIENAAASLNSTAISVIIAAFLVMAAISYFLPEITKILCSSIFSSIVMSLGTILFLWAISITPFALINKHRLQSAGYFSLLIAVSIIIQWLFSRHKPIDAEQAENSPKIAQQPVVKTSNSWRSS